MLADLDRFICPYGHGPLRPPDAVCDVCGRRYRLASLPPLWPANGQAPFGLYDFRPDAPEVEQDRRDLEAHQKVVEGLLWFEERNLRDWGFADLPAGLDAARRRDSRLLAYGVYAQQTFRNVLEWAWHARSGRPTKKVGAGDSVQSAFAGYSRAYEVISDFARPTWLGWYEGRLKYAPAMLHHHKNMLVLRDRLRRWGATDVLEFGCGTGINLLLLRRACADGGELQLSGCDYALSRVLMTRGMTEQHDVRCRNVFVADGRSLPLRDESFDVVFSHYVIEQMAGYEDEALASMLRVARVGVVLFETAAHHLTFNQRLYMAHSGYSRGLVDAIRRRSDVTVEELRNNRDDCFFGCPNVVAVLRKRGRSGGG